LASSNRDRSQEDELSKQFNLESVKNQIAQLAVDSTSPRLPQLCGEKEQPTGVKREPSFGQRTRFYPFGYGYCQCGCKGTTERFSSGIYPMYLPGHHSSDSNLKSQESTGDKDIEVINPATLKAGERLLRGTKDSPPPSVSPKRFVAPDQPLLELYVNLVQKHELLELQMNRVCLEIENTITLIKNVWRGSASEKQLVVEELQAMLDVLKTTR
jgi:hypothetical protein